MQKHEHDGSGCIDCSCDASPVNTAPCICPEGAKEELGRGIEQSPLFFANRSNPGQHRFGEMTKKKTSSGYVFTVHIYGDYSNMIDNCDFSIYVAPRLFGSIRPNHPTDESHIIRGSE